MDASDPAEGPRSAEVVVIGTGSAGLPAALAANDSGAEVLVLEKAPKIGGTTAVSGGGMWIPNSPQVVEARGRSPRSGVKTYLRRVVGDGVPEPLIDAFLDTGPEVVEFLETVSELEFRYTEQQDYHPEFPGAQPKGRMIEPRIYDAGTQLGDRLEDVRESPHFSYPGRCTNSNRPASGPPTMRNCSRPSRSERQRTRSGWVGPSSRGSTRPASSRGSSSSPRPRQRGYRRPVGQSPA